MLRNFFAREELVRNQAGQTLVEYGLLVGLIAVICIVAVTLLLGQQVSGFFDKITDAL